MCRYAHKYKKKKKIYINICFFVNIVIIHYILYTNISNRIEYGNSADPDQIALKVSD